MEKRCRPHLTACSDAWKGDETSINVRKTWMDLSRAVDSEGNTLELLLNPTRDAEAATRFFLKALPSTACSAQQASTVDQRGAQVSPTAEFTPPKPLPRVSNVDKHAAYPKAMADLKAARLLPECVKLRHVKYLNNLVEQDHRCIKRRVKAGMGFFAFTTAEGTLPGYEVMNRIRKGQMRGVKKGDIAGQISFIARNGPRPFVG